MSRQNSEGSKGSISFSDVRDSETEGSDVRRQDRTLEVD